MEKIQQEINNKNYYTAIELLRLELSGIDWNEDAIPNETLNRDNEILSIINDLYFVRLCGDQHFLDCALLRLQYLQYNNVDILNNLSDKIVAAALIAENELENI